MLITLISMLSRSSEHAHMGYKHAHMGYEHAYCIVRMLIVVGMLTVYKHISK